MGLLTACTSSLEQIRNAAETKTWNRLIFHEYNKTTDQIDKEQYIFTTIKQFITGKDKLNLDRPDGELAWLDEREDPDWLDRPAHQHEHMHYNALTDSTVYHTSNNICPPHRQEALRAMRIPCTHQTASSDNRREQSVHSMLFWNKQRNQPISLLGWIRPLW